MRAPDDMPRRERRPRRSRSGRSGRGRVILVVAAVILLVLVISLRGIAGFYTDYLWFDSVGQTSVWRGVLGTKLALAGVFVGGFFALLFINLTIADRIAPRFRPTGPEAEMIERYHELVGGRTGLVRVAVALVLAVIAGAPASAQWNEWLLFRNGVDFGVDDPQFGRDVGFYVFDLPFLTFVVGWLFAAFVIVLVVTAVAHYLNGGIRVQAPFQRVTPQVKAHLSLLLGALALIKAAGYYLQQFELTVSTRGTVDGATYTDVNAQLPAIRLLLLISLAAMVLFVVNIFLRGWVLPALGVGLWVFVAGVAGTIVPAFVQRFQVEPSESSKERPFIERNIAATRAALGLEVENRDFAADGAVTSDDLMANLDTVANIRLWDPSPGLLGQTYRQLQALQPFYRIDDVDVDRYEIDGATRQVMIAARELNTEGVPQTSWEARQLAYTHGYGVVLSSANAQRSDGSPDLLLRDIPLRDTIDLGLDEPSIYFGDGLGGYVIVDTKREEIDYQGRDQSEAQLRNYAGEDGVDMGSLVRRAAFALRFGDINPLVSGNLTGESKILINRDVRVRLQAVAPFLEYDGDPYPVVVEGRIKWIVDAYTTTSRYPYAQRAITEGNAARSGLQGRFNYVRNSVKAVLDAYDGSFTLYVVDPEDPIIRAYQQAFPSLFTSEAPPEALASHFRYPEDLFRVQTNMWGRYHIDNPDTFYNNSDAWLVALAPTAPVVQAGGTTDVTAVQPDAPPRAENRIDPYYLLMRLPNEERSSFLILRPFVPISEDDGRQNLTAFMVAKSDPGEYGKLQVYVMRGDQPPGPVLAANTIGADEDVSRLQTELGVRGGGTDLLFGNLLLIPIEQSLLYVRPVYVQTAGDANKLPLLRKVVVEFDGEVGVGDDLGDALRSLARFRNLPELPGERTGPPPDDGTPPPDDGVPDPDVTAATLLAEAEQLFAEADAALQKSPPDFATYADKVADARERLREATELLGAEPPPTDGTETDASTDSSTDATDVSTSSA